MREKAVFASAALLLFSFVGADCTPTSAEAGSAVLLVAPVVFLVGLGILGLLRVFWRPLVELRPLEPKPLLVTFFILLVLSALGVAGPERAREWALVALLVFGSSFMTLLLLVWRVWFFRKKQTAFTWAPIATMAFMIFPAPLFVLARPDRSVGDPVVAGLWMLPGMFGYAAVPMLVLAFGEIMVRRLLRKDPEKD